MIKPDIHMGSSLKSEIPSQQIKRSIPSNSLNQEKATSIQLICIARMKLRHRPQQLSFLYVIWLQSTSQGEAERVSFTNLAVLNSAKWWTNQWPPNAILDDHRSINTTKPKPSLSSTLQNTKRIESKLPNGMRCRNTNPAWFEGNYISPWALPLTRQRYLHNFTRKHASWHAGHWRQQLAYIGIDRVIMLVKTTSAIHMKTSFHK